MRDARAHLEAVVNELAKRTTNGRLRDELAAISAAGPRDSRAKALIPVQDGKPTVLTLSAGARVKLTGYAVRYEENTQRIQRNIDMEDAGLKNHR